MKVLILTVPAGGGHYHTAKAIKEHLSRDAKTECRILDVAKHGNKFVSAVISKGYVLVSTYLPWGYRFFYNLMDKRTRHSYTFVSYLLDLLLGKKLTEYIKEYKPEVIVSTHLFATVVLNLQAKKHKTDAKLISIITDFTVHPMWEQAKSDYFITASELLNDEAEKKFTTTQNVLPLGIPIKSSFIQTMPKDDACKKANIENKFTVLVMMGSFGYGNAAGKIIQKLDNLEEDFQIIVVCGSNERMKKKIESQNFKKEVIVYGFCENISELMDCCDCIVTKPGGLSLSEALAKNTPIILTNAIPGHEERNLKLIKKCGAGVCINRRFTVDKAVSKLINSEQYREELIKNSRDLAKPDATRSLAELIYKIKSHKAERLG